MASPLKVTSMMVDKPVMKMRKPTPFVRKQDNDSIGDLRSAYKSISGTSPYRDTGTSRHATYLRPPDWNEHVPKRASISSFNSSGVFDDDWSGTGRGSHVEFDHNETLPLQQGRFLGRGTYANVYETSIAGISLAWKRMDFKRKVDVKKKKEIEILKRLSHVHMIQLVGTYTHQRQLGILLYPVASCDLQVFFEDVEAHCMGRSDHNQKAQLGALGYFEDFDPTQKALPIYGRIGCLIGAIAYLHSQSIRHKDLKPSNILLSPGSLYLSDFGTATDFSLASQSATDNGGGTLRYCAPEVANYEKAGRAADMFSLGCILLEILILNRDGNLQHLRNYRTRGNPAFHANLHQINAWLPTYHIDEVSPRDFHLIRAIRNMLSSNDERRPSSEQLLFDMRLCDMMTTNGPQSMFGSCCQRSPLSSSIQAREVPALYGDLKRAEKECATLKESLTELKKAHAKAIVEKQEAQYQLIEARTSLGQEIMRRSETFDSLVEARLEIEALKVRKRQKREWRISCAVTDVEQKQVLSFKRTSAPLIVTGTLERLLPEVSAPLIVAETLEQSTPEASVLGIYESIPDLSAHPQWVQMAEPHYGIHLPEYNYGDRLRTRSL